MKLNWGTGIAIALIVFVGILTTLAVYFMNQKVELVTNNYYDKELVYQNDIDRMNESVNLKEPVTVSLDEKNVMVIFPKEVLPEGVSGEILFYKPSDSNKDFKINFDLKNDSLVAVGINKFTKGLWRAKITWHTPKSNYYNEEIIHIN